MAKKSLLERNLRRSQYIERDAQRRSELKAKIRDKNLPLSERFKLVQKLDSMRVDGSRVRYRRRCLLTGRGRGVVHKHLCISRIKMRDLMALGQIPGYRKASW